MKVFLDTIGCRLNQSEIERYAREFRAAGHTIVDNAAEADLVVVNTCAVTREAAADSRQKARQAARLGNAKIVLTGCWSTLEPVQAALLPQVNWVVANPDKDHLVSTLLNLPDEMFDREPLARKPLPGAHARTRAFIKVQDGCDNHCTFCVTRIARGQGHSQRVDQVLDDVRAALEGGAREVVLSGVHLGSWGQDFDRPQHLRDLIATLLAETPVERIRLSSLEPWDLDADFFQLWQDERLCRHLHLPLQSGCASTLKRMARKITPNDFAELIEHARAAIPGLAITTDVIVGFPGETDIEFQEGLDFVRGMDFAGGHVFAYSARPGTAAARLTPQVEKPIRKQRSAEMRAVFAQADEQFRRQFIGQPLRVLWESAQPDGDRWLMSGLSDNYLRVFAPASENLWNHISTVNLVELSQDGLKGTIRA